MKEGELEEGPGEKESAWPRTL
ncbi:hypothetical protein B14911_16985 [Bacillus sp. NRRL B-14911]|nr:hypothetical protein B14911_16985 [Bacillus sp. NRRL B-14911]